MEKIFPQTDGMPDFSFDPAKSGKMKVDTYNQQSGNLSGYDCKICRNRGNIAAVKEDGTLTFRECDCMKIRRCVQKMEKSGMREVLEKYTFEAYQAPDPWRQRIKHGAMYYADHPSGWLLFCGQSGSGKTHLCTAVCKKFLLDGVDVRYMPWRSDAATIRAASADAERRSKLLEPLQLAPVLFIDDLFKSGRSPDGSRFPSATDVSIAFDIVNYRYTKQLPTIISTECYPLELVEIDEATGGRIIEMAGRNTFCIAKQKGRNYRLRNVVTV